MKYFILLICIIGVCFSCEDPLAIEKCPIRTPSPTLEITPEPADLPSPENTPGSTSGPTPVDEPEPDVTPADEPTLTGTPLYTDGPAPEPTPDLSDPTPDNTSGPTPELTPESATPLPEVTPIPTYEPTPEIPGPTPVLTIDPTPEIPGPTPVLTIDPTPFMPDPTLVLTIEPTPAMPDPTPVLTIEPTPAIPDPTPERTIEPTPEITAEPTPVQTTEPGQGVENTRASVLGYNGKILLTWDHIPGAGSYMVYTYTIKDPLGLVSSWNTADNLYDDEDISADSFVPDIGRPYFYKVSWIDDGLEYGPGDEYIFGLCSDAPDPFEPGNNDYADIVNNTSTVFDPLNPPVIYSMSDGTGRSVKDTDWYKYRGVPRFVNVELTLTEGWSSAFLTREDINLYFTFFYNGQAGVSRKIIADISNFYFYTEDFGEVTGDADLYYKLHVQAPSFENVIESYRVSVTHSY